MSERILKTEINREKDYLYFVKGDPLELHKAKMQHGGRKKKKS